MEIVHRNARVSSPLRPFYFVGQSSSQVALGLESLGGLVVLELLGVEGRWQTVQVRGAIPFLVLATRGALLTHPL